MSIFSKKSPEEKKLQEQINKINDIQTRNALTRTTLQLRALEQAGLPTKYEQDPINGYALNYYPFNELDLGFVNQFPVNAFPREMYPDRPTTIRTPIAEDVIIFESRKWYETQPIYSGLINHLRNYIVGDGLKLDVVSDTDEQLAEDIKTYLEEFCYYKYNKLDKRVSDSVLNYFRDGNDALQLFAGSEYPEIRSVDITTVRGPHWETTGPWAFGMLVNWPVDWEEIKAYHVWYSDNTHKDISPNLLKFLKAETTGANVKRGMPLSYRMRRQLQQLTMLTDCSVIGEAVRQSIPYIKSYELQQRDQVQGLINSRVPNQTQLYQQQFNNLGDPKQEIIPGEVRHIGPGQAFNPPPSGADGTWAYQILCGQIAASAGVPLWMVSGSANETNFASSLVAESPLIPLLRAKQKIISEHYERVLEAVVEIASAQGKFPLDALKTCKIHCEFPSPEARNRKEQIEIDLKLLQQELISPQHVCARNDLDFTEERDLLNEAKENGWESPADKMGELKEDPNTSENPNNEKKDLEGEDIYTK